MTYRTHSARTNSTRRSEAAGGRPVTARAPAVRGGGRLTEARRQEIVSKAAALFISKGYANVTVDEIIDLIGGSKTTLYSRFGGKEGLFETVIRQPCSEVTLALDVNAKGSLETQLTQIARAFLKSVLDPNILELHRLMVSIGKTFPAAGAFFYEKGPDTAYAIVAGWIKRQQAAGRLAGGDARQLAVLFLDMLIGEHQLAFLTSGRKPSAKAIDRTVRTSVRLFLNGTRKQTAG